LLNTTLLLKNKKENRENTMANNTSNANIPAPVFNLSVSSYYTDSARSEVGVEAKKQYDKLTKGLKNFLSSVVDMADHKLKSERVRAVQWLAEWAKKGALLGEITAGQAQHVRKWNASGYALSYLKIKDVATPAQKTIIEGWLEKLADSIFNYYSRDEKSVKNNHWYWFGLTMGAIGLATGSDKYKNICEAVLLDAIKDIDKDGTLPKELARGQRALHYHCFAAMGILTMVGLMRTSKKFALSKTQAVSLQKLVSLCASGLVDPEIFQKLTDIEQDDSSRGFAGWLEIFNIFVANGTPAVKVDGVEDEMEKDNDYIGGSVENLIKKLKEFVP
jgi:poly(beta-D-mannuronate) lyase